MRIYNQQSPGAAQPLGEPSGCLGPPKYSGALKIIVLHLLSQRRHRRPPAAIDLPLRIGRQRREVDELLPEEAEIRDQADLQRGGLGQGQDHSLWIVIG